MGQAVTITPDAPAVTITPDAPPESGDTVQQSFLQRAATQPSKFSHLNPLRYADELGQGMAQGLEMLAHPVDTATKLYQTAMAPHPMDFSDASDKPLLEQAKEGVDTLAQGYGQMAVLGPATKLAEKGTGALSDTAKAAVTKAADAARNATPKQVAQVAGAGAGAIAGKGILSPAGAYYGAKLGNVAEFLLGKDRANAPIFAQHPDLTLDNITDALADTIAADRERYQAQQANGLGLQRPTGAKPAAQTGEALADLPNPSQQEAEAKLREVTAKKPLGNELGELPATGAKPAAETGEALGNVTIKPDTEPPTGGTAAPRFNASDRAAAKSLLQDALSQHTADVVDKVVPASSDPVANLRTQSVVDTALKNGDVGTAEAALAQANPAWTPKDRLPVPTTAEIRARIQSQNQTPSGFADVQNDNQVLDAMRYDLNRHGWSAESEARREFIARNSTGMTKGELGREAGMVGAEEKPVVFTKTPGVNYTPTTEATAAPQEEAPNAIATRRARVSQAVSQPIQASSEPAPGAQTAIRVPGEERKYAANYEVRELEDVHPSHNGVSFAENPKYQLVNDRDYSNPANQGKIIDWSGGKFDPAYLISDSPDVTNGAMAWDSEGQVLGGNGRTMILQRVYKLNPEGAQAYRDMLAQKAPNFGVDPAKIQSMKQPVLGRKIDDLEFAKPNAKQSSITDFNKKGTAELTPSERAIADSGRVSQRTLDDIAARVEEQGPNGTLADILRGKSGAEVLNNLIDDGVMSPQERAAFTSESGLTDAGKDRISNLLVGRFFRDAAQIDSTPVSLRNKLEKMAAPLAKLDGVENWDLIPHMQQAIDLLEEARTHGGNIEDLLSQRGLFGESKYSQQATTLAKSLQNSTGNELLKSVRQYSQDAADAHRPLLLGETIGPKEAFDEAFGAGKSAKTKATGTERPAVDLNNPAVLQDQIQKSLEAIRQKRQQR